MSPTRKSLSSIWESCQSYQTFDELLSRFEAAPRVYRSAYQRVEHQLYSTTSRNSITETRHTPLSKHFQCQRRVREFCLARLVEFSEEGMGRTSIIQRVVEEIGQAEEWDDDVFVRTVPLDKDLSDRESEPDDGYFHSHIVKIMNEYGRLLAVTVSDFLPWFWKTLCVRRLRRYYFPFMIVALGIGISMILCPKTFRFTISTIMDFIHAQPIIQQGVHLSRFVINWSTLIIWSSRLSSLFSVFSNVSWPISFLTTPKLNLMGWSWGRFASPKEHISAVGFPTVPLFEGIYEAANIALYMTEMAGNTSTMPRLLDDTHKSVWRAAAHAKLSRLKHRDKLIQEYSDLVICLNALFTSFVEFNSKSRVLVASFVPYLSDVIAAMDDIHTPTDEYWNLFLSLGIAPCLAMIRWQGIYRATTLAVCVPIPISHTITTFCANRLENLDRGSLCSAYLTYTSTLIGDYREIVQRRKLALHQLRNFFTIWNSKMGELYDVADRGIKLSVKTERISKRIHYYMSMSNPEFVQEAHDDAQDVRNQKQYLLRMLQSWWATLTGRRARQQKDEKIKFWFQEDQYHLGQIQLLNGAAYDMLSYAKEALEVWKTRVVAIAQDFVYYQKQASEEGENWQQIWDNWSDWKRLKSDFRSLRQVLDKLKDAQEQQSPKA